MRLTNVKSEILFLFATDDQKHGRICCDFTMLDLAIVTKPKMLK